MGKNQILKHISLLIFLKFFILFSFFPSPTEAGITSSSLSLKFKDEKEPESFGTIFVSIIKGSGKGIRDFNASIYDKTYVFSSFKISDNPIYILHTETSCLIDTGKSYIYWAISNEFIPKFLESSPKFEGAKIDCISQLMTPEVGQDLFEVLGESGFLAITHYLRLDSKSRIRSARIEYGNGPSPWMHFLLKPAEKKSWQLYCAASLKVGSNGKPNLISKGFAEYVEDIDHFIRALDLAKRSKTEAGAAEE